LNINSAFTSTSEYVKLDMLYFLTNRKPNERSKNAFFIVYKKLLKHLSLIIICCG